MSRQNKLLLMLASVAGLYLLSRTRMGERASSSLTDAIARLITGEEGVRLTVYKDIGGKWTVGRGHLILASDRVTRDGASVALHPFGPVKTITEAESDAFFERDTATARNAVANRVTVPISQNERAALSSLVFNIGTGAFAQSTLLKLLNAGNRAAAADQFLVWRKVNGVDSPGLLARRERERQLFLS